MNGGNPSPPAEGCLSPASPVSCNQGMGQSPGSRSAGSKSSDSRSPNSLCLKGQGVSCRAPETPLDTEEEVRRLVSVISRQASRGFTGETWYDFDLPLDRKDPIVILHFNDVYNVDSRPDGSGGISRFVSALQRFSHLHPLIFFSGDALNPSLMSTYTKGRHMIPFLNLLKVHTACLGNHDFDFGIDELEYSIGSSNFPWLITNVFERRGTEDERVLEEILEAEAALLTADASASAAGALTLKVQGAERAVTEAAASGEGEEEARQKLKELRVQAAEAAAAAESARALAEELRRRVLSGNGAQQAVDAFLGLPGEPVANAGKYRLFDWQGVRIGVIGLVERESRDLVYVDYVVAANRMARFLRAKECELIIALTHMRSPNDQRLAELATDVDIILGGHDHEYYGLQLIGGRPVLKSGTDFFDFTAMALYPGDTSPKPPLLEPLIQRDASPPEVKAGDRAAAAVGIAPSDDGRKRSPPSPLHCPSTRIALSPSHQPQTPSAANPTASSPVSGLEKRQELHPQVAPLQCPWQPPPCEGRAERLADSSTSFPSLSLQPQRKQREPSPPRGSRIQWSRVQVTPEAFPKNKHVELLVKKYERHLKKQMHCPLASLGCDLETRFSIIRRQESNCGNWLCELMRKECRSDVAILNSGTIRSDALFKAGVLRFGDLAAMLPMIDPLAVVSVTGKILLAILENSVSQLPKAEGRFLQVAGLRFAFDSSKPPGSRVIRSSVVVRRYSAERGEESVSASPLASPSSSSFAALGFEPLQEESEYSLTAKAYLLQGKDGYSMLLGRPVLVEEELLPPLPTLVRNALAMTDLANGHGRPHSRIMSRQLSSFRTLHSDALKTFGCSRQRREMQTEFVIAPKCDGRVHDVAKAGKA